MTWHDEGLHIRLVVEQIAVFLVVTCDAGRLWRIAHDGDLLRSQARRPAIQLTESNDETNLSQLWDNLMSHNNTAEDIYDRKQQAESVRKIIAQLPDHLRQILILAYFKQLSYKEMAQVLDIPLGTVKSRLHSAVAHSAQEFRELSCPPERNDSANRRDL